MFRGALCPAFWSRWLPGRSLSEAANHVALHVGASFITVWGVGAILLRSVIGEFATLVLMGAQSVLLAPANEGATPETIRENDPRHGDVVGVSGHVDLGGRILVDTGRFQTDGRWYFSHVGVRFVSNCAPPLLVFLARTANLREN